MSRAPKWKIEKTKVKVVFRLQFHATNVSYHTFTLILSLFLLFWLHERFFWQAILSFVPELVVQYVWTLLLISAKQACLICYINNFGCRFRQQDGTNYFCPSSLLIRERWLQRQIKQMSGMGVANGQILSMKQHGFFRILALKHMMTSSISLLWPWYVPDIV